MIKKYDTLVFIGRFQPFHLGHKKIVDIALTLSKELVIVIGSSNSSRDIRNPFTAKEREDIIRATYPHSEYPHIRFVHAEDYRYNTQKWLKQIRQDVLYQISIGHNLRYLDNPEKANIGLIGHSKDNSSYYLKLFPEWGSVSVPNFENLNSTTIRESLFNDAEVGNPITKESFSMLNDIILSGKYTWFAELKREYDMIRDYKESWKNSPFPPVFVTVDCIVTCSAHILLIKRKDSPGKNQWALPGGFIDQEETLIESAIRELKEETKIKVPSPVLKGSIIQEKTFDDPHRSSRGRTITSAYHIDLKNELSLPKVTANDDAIDVRWIPFNEVKRDMMFEDHYDIFDYFTGAG